MSNNIKKINGATKPVADRAIRTAFDAHEIEKEFHEVKSKYLKITGSVVSVSAIGLTIGSLTRGATFPAKALRVIGDSFASIAAILTPYMLGKNELNEYNAIKHGKKTGESADEDSLSEFFYRCVSLGFSPYIFEQLINPEKIFKSKSSKLAAIINLPTLIFTIFTFGLGSINSIVTWGLRTAEQKKLDKKLTDPNASSEELEKLYKRKQSYNQLYESVKRYTVIGGIALPAMHGVMRWSECWDAIFSGEESLQDFFNKPFLALSKSISLVIGIPEAIAKGYDSLARVVHERKHLKNALPQSLVKPIDEFAEAFERQATSKSNNIVKGTRHAAQVIFHTLSPLSQIAFAIPMMHTPILNENAQSVGGLPAILNKIIGVYGKAAVSLTTLPYAFASRLPQAISQINYFTKYYMGHKNKTDEELEAEIRKTQEKICAFGPIKFISEKAHNLIKHLVPDYYTAEHKYGFPSFEDIQANDSFKQAEEIHKDLLTEGSTLTTEEREKIINDCKNYVRKTASRAYYEMKEKELTTIKGKIELKIDEKLNPKLKKERRTNLAFPGASLLTQFIRPFDFVHRFKSLDIRSPFHRMETTYHISEIAEGFEKELYIMLADAIASGTSNTINRLQGIEVPTLSTN